MNNLYGLLDANTLWAQIVDYLLPRLLSVGFLIQVASIAGAALLALWLAPRAVALFRRLFVTPTAWPWLQALANVLASISVPGLWLILLGVFSEAGRSAGFNMTLARDGVSLLNAWVVIRLLAHVVRHPLWSSVIFFTAWTFAALDILGVLGQIESSLDSMAFMYGTVRISALNFVRALMVMGVLLWIAALVRGFVEKRIFHASSLTPSLQNILSELLKLALPAIAVIMALPVLGLDLTALTVFSGALALGVRRQHS